MNWREWPRPEYRRKKRSHTDDARSVRSLFDREPSEVAEFNDFGDVWVFDFKLVQRFIQGQQSFLLKYLWTELPQIGFKLLRSDISKIVL